MSIEESLTSLGVDIKASFGVLDDSPAARLRLTYAALHGWIWDRDLDRKVADACLSTVWELCMSDAP